MNHLGFVLTFRLNYSQFCMLNEWMEWNNSNRIRFLIIIIHQKKPKGKLCRWFYGFLMITQILFAVYRTKCCNELNINSRLHAKTTPDVQPNNLFSSGDHCVFESQIKWKSNLSITELLFHLILVFEGDLCGWGCEGEKVGFNESKHEKSSCRHMSVKGWFAIFCQIFSKTIFNGFYIFKLFLMKI